MEIQDEIHFDADARFEGSKNEVILLLVVATARKKVREEDTLAGLILQSTGDFETYRCVGFFYTTRAQVYRILKNMPRHKVNLI